MKSRTSFFDKTVLKKDLTRFFPLWALYLIGGLLIMHVTSGFYDEYYSNRAYSIARDLNTIVAPLGIFSAGYGFLAAQLLFGDLHNTRLCFGVHAFPLRRENWYLTHTVAGLLMGLVPPLVIVLTLMPLMGQFWFTGLLAWAVMALHYLFFFGLAVFSMICTGNRFAATAVYGILNFLAQIIRWFGQTIYLPLLPGVRVNTGAFDLFSPTAELVQRDDFFKVTHLSECALCRQQQVIGHNGIIVEIAVDGGTHDYAFQGLGSDWGYVLILAAVGIALLGAGLALYRIRHLERAGDFMAFKPMKPIFLTVYTLCVGCVMFYLAYETSGEAAGYLFCVVGIFLGFFTGRMLLERTLRVFRGKAFVGLGILSAAMALSLLLTWIDPVGISRRIPKTERVEVLYLYDGHLSDYQLSNPDRLANNDNVIAITDPEDIAAIRQSHQLMLQEHNTKDYRTSRWFTLQYKLKNGTTVSRTYRIASSGEGWNSVKTYLTKPNYLFSVGSLEQLLSQTRSMFSSDLGQLPEAVFPELLTALWQDAQLGYISAGNSVNAEFIQYLELRVGNQYRVLFFGPEASHISPLMQELHTYPQFLLRYDTLEELIDNTHSIYLLNGDTKLSKDQYVDFLTLLYQDCQKGKLSSYGKFSNGYNIEIELTGDYLSLCLSPDSKSVQWIEVHYPHSH